MKLHLSIDDILKVWVRRWASYKGVKGYPSLQSFARESKQVIQHYSITELNDEAYVRIDEALDILREINLDAYQVLMAVFLQRQDRKVICETIGISPKTYHEKLNAAKSFMEGAVFGGGVIKIKL